MTFHRELRHVEKPMVGQPEEFEVLPSYKHFMKEVLYGVRCLKSTEDMILALAGQFKQLSHEPEKFR